MPTPSLRRPGGRSRRRLGALLAIPALVAPMLLTAGTGPASANPTNAGPDVAPALLPDSAEPVPVTLITGDTVHWADAGDGSPRVEIDEAPRDYPVDFDQSGTQEDFYVIPSDAMPQVVAGTVDMELFNIPSLIRQGLDDQATGGELPVIVTFDQDRTPQRLESDANAIPAASSAQAIERVNGAGVKINRSNASAFRAALLGKPGNSGGRGSNSSTPNMDGQLKQVLLDQVLEIDLAESVPQIGAPQAWAAGYTGDGVTVAVLDTGVDTSHPDLAGQVVAEANFTDEPDASDTHGHGTHVASTIAGTGAASEGARRGVAPGTDLLSGKVCNSDGQCQTSWIMAGMEWATAQQSADVVNMSLGGAPTDGTDQLSQLVDQLSAETGALFVIAAGNSGCQLAQVGSPGAATAALAVGAVDKSDQMASFSSCGPRAGDHAVKPEITAPGVGIVAARAAGSDLGTPVDDHYTSLNGTSMATPHVAGSAALLAQANPDLSWLELKDALVSTAADGGFRWYQQGTGRVDVPAALGSPVYVTGTVNFGSVEGQAQQDITYVNHSDNDVTLSLDVAVTDRAGQAVGAVALSTDSVTVPAGGQASVTVTLDAAEVSGLGPYGGVVTATGPDVALRTAVGFGPPLHRVTIEVLDSAGDRIGTETSPDRIVRLIHDTFDDRHPVGARDYGFRSSEGIATGLVPTGTYTILLDVRERDPDTGELVRNNVLTEVEVDIEAETTLRLDSRDAVPIGVTVPRKVDNRPYEVALIREYANSPPGAPGATFTLRAGSFGWPTYVTPAPAGELATVALYVRWVLAEPQPVQPVFGSSACPRDLRQCYIEAPAYIYNVAILYENGIPDSLHEKVTRRDLVEVPTRYHSDNPDVLIRRGFVAHPPIHTVLGGLGDEHQVWIRPGRVTEYFLADDHIAWNRIADLQYRKDGIPPTFLFTQWSPDRFPAAEAGTRRGEERWFEAPIRVGVPDFRQEYLDDPNGYIARATASRGGPDGNQFVPGGSVMDNARHSDLETPFGTWRMWNLDTGTELEGVSGSVIGFPWLPAFPLGDDEATFRLEHTGTYPVNKAPLFQTGPATTTWTFVSRASDAAVPDGYRCPIRDHNTNPQEPWSFMCQIQPLIQLEYELGLDIHNRVSAGRAHRFTVTAGHHSKAIDRAPVTSMTVQASFDDGHTWRDARVVGKPKDTWDTGGFLRSAAPYQQFKVVLMIPPLYRTNGFVTLRVQAEDANGGTLDQTIPRAYILK